MIFHRSPQRQQKNSQGPYFFPINLAPEKHRGDAGDVLFGLHAIVPGASIIIFPK